MQCLYMEHPQAGMSLTKKDQAEWLTPSSVQNSYCCQSLPEFELPFKKIGVSWIRYIRKHTSKEIISADLLVSVGKFSDS